MGKSMTKIMVIGGAALVGATLVAAPGGSRERASADDAARALVYGRADASWTPRVAALVTADGRAAATIGRVAEATNVDGLARSRALDALALAGTMDAQAAMRHALASPAVRAQPTYPMLVATLGTLALPSMETLSFLAETRDQAVAHGEAELAAASATALDRAYNERLTSLAAGKHLRQARSAAPHKR